MIAILLALGAPARSAECEDGSVVDRPENATLEVRWTVRDEQGQESQRAVTVIRPTRFTPRVQATTSFDEKTGLHSYRYAITNDAASEQQIGSVELALPPRVRVSGATVGGAGPGWHLFPSPSGEGGFSWAFLVGTSRPDLTVEGIPQGGTVTFSFQSPNPPGVVDLHLSGVAPEAVFEDLPGCVEDLVIDLTGFPRDTVRVQSVGPVASP